MGGWEEFDQERMAREERDYFAVRNPRLMMIGEAVSNHVARAGNARRAAEQDAEQIAYLRSLTYLQYLKTDHWQRMRRKALLRDNHQCRKCASKRNLDVHHLSYERIGEESIWDLITLCRHCHKLCHKVIAR